MLVGQVVLQACVKQSIPPWTWAGYSQSRGSEITEEIMASKKKSKVVGKDDLRRLMKEKSSGIKSTTKRIDSPLAKYNTLGQLVCVVCNSQVKSELLWKPHLQGRTHKENLAKLKEEQERPKVAKPVPPKPTSAAAPRSILKRKESEVPEEIQRKVAKVAVASTGLKGTNDSGIGLSGYGSSDEDEDASTTKAAPDAKSDQGKAPSGLPADFFDSNRQPADNPEGGEEGPSQSMAEKLPEGFFDDPKTDAKVRQVEYKDKMEEEWTSFQKAMKEQATISEAIVEEEEDNAVTERNLDEIDEQLHRWSKVDSLQKKKEEIMAKVESKTEDTEGDSDIDEQEFEEFLDWRTKKAWK